MKSEISNHISQIKSNDKIPATRTVNVFCYLIFAILYLLMSWCLGFGISNRAA
jgi:hypothetical protein